MNALDCGEDGVLSAQWRPRVSAVPSGGHGPEFVFGKPGLYEEKRNIVFYGSESQVRGG